MAKRIFDLGFACAALALFAPFMLVIAFLVKLDSTGPILFRQARVGRYGRLFRINKFRTMSYLPKECADGPLVTSDADSRITRTGRWLRFSKADELPQLFNVIIGDMSIVGPRPEVPEYVEFYPLTVREKILSVRPGITDEAAIIFRNESSVLASADDPEEAYVHEILPIKISLYEKYVDRHSLSLDLNIIFRTFLAVFSASGQTSGD